MAKPSENFDMQNMLNVVKMLNIVIRMNVVHLVQRYTYHNIKHKLSFGKERALFSLSQVGQGREFH